MPNTFQDKRDSHLKQAQAFLYAAQLRVSDNLPFRTAVSDAVESIKHSLQSYIWQRAGVLFPRDPAARLQEIATKGSMPELLSAAQEDGMQLGDVAQRIRELNDLRNQYTHGLPQRGVLVTQETADDAVKLAQRIDQRVQRALGLPTATAPAPTGSSRAGVAASAAPASTRTPSAAVASAPSVSVKSVPVPTLAAAAAAPATIPAAGLAAGVRPTSPSAVTSPSTPAPGSAGGALAEPGGGDDDDAAESEVDLATLPTSARRRRFPWLATLVAVLMLLLGVAGGGATVYSLASGHAPAWLPLPASFAPLAATAPPVPSPTATALPTGPFVAGDLLITPSGCGISPATLTLRNTGATPLSWSTGSPDTPGAAFALSSGSVARPTVAGQLAPGATITLTITGIAPGAAHIVVVTTGGTVVLAIGAC
ncbi:MAG TPA: hypothetical protein VGN32_14565 [Ktedonobacterales bacterium]|nr:hypothetical protein [Ktedonobacterales bacterium]